MFNTNMPIKYFVFAGLNAILDIICDNVSHEWRSLAKILGISKSECDVIERENPVANAQCWEAISIWRRRTSPALQPRMLTESLIKCRQRRVADIMDKLLHSRMSVDDTLEPHIQREG